MTNVTIKKIVNVLLGMEEKTKQRVVFHNEKLILQEFLFWNKVKSLGLVNDVLKNIMSFYLSLYHFPVEKRVLEYVWEDKLYRADKGPTNLSPYGGLKNVGTNVTNFIFFTPVKENVEVELYLLYEKCIEFSHLKVQ